MSKDMPFPYPCTDLPKFNSQHKVAVLIEEYKRSGHIKQCTYVGILQVGSMTYRVHCKKGSFDLRKEGRVSDDYLFYGCPKDCRMYRAAWWGKPALWLKEQWWPFRGLIIGTAQWYATLSMPVQAIGAVILLAIVLALVGSFLGDTILEALRIIFAK